MTVREIRNRTGLTQTAFSDRYHIPLQTLRQWESAPESTSHRNPPEYVTFMLDRLAALDCPDMLDAERKHFDYLIKAAVQSRYNAGHWLRYLRKEVSEEGTALTPRQVSALLSDDRLTLYQKISLKRAMQPGSATNRYVLSLNMPADRSMYTELLRKIKHDDPG